MRSVTARFALVVALCGTLAGVSSLDGGAVVAQESGTVYRFGTSKKHTNVTFVSEAEIENIYGSTNVVEGQTFLNFDEGRGKCNVRIPVEHMKTGIELRDEHMRSDQWLDAEQYPEIQFRSSDVTFSKSGAGGSYRGKAKGEITIHGVTRELEADVRLRKVPEKFSKMIGDGQWVRVTTEFDVKLSDFDIEIPAGQVAAKVSQVWRVKFDSYATTAKDE